MYMSFEQFSAALEVLIYIANDTNLASRYAVHPGISNIFRLVTCKHPHYLVIYQI